MPLNPTIFDRVLQNFPRTPTSSRTGARSFGLFEIAEETSPNQSGTPDSDSCDSALTVRTPRRFGPQDIQITPWQGQQISWTTIDEAASVPRHAFTSSDSTQWDATAARFEELSQRLSSLEELLRQVLSAQRAMLELMTPAPKFLGYQMTPEGEIPVYSTPAPLSLPTATAERREESSLSPSMSRASTPGDASPPSTTTLSAGSRETTRSLCEFGFSNPEMDGKSSMSLPLCSEQGPAT
jgi:hypothetical protein